MKSGLVKNFGRWEDGRRDIELRSHVFDWEVDIWEEFFRMIERVIPVECVKDWVIWALSTCSKFLCRSFRRSIARVDLVLDRWKALRVFPVPLKVKCFTWLLLKNRLAMRARLFCLGLVKEEGVACPICGDGREQS